MWIQKRETRGFPCSFMPASDLAERSVANWIISHLRLLRFWFGQGYDEAAGLSRRTSLRTDCLLNMLRRTFLKPLALVFYSVSKKLFRNNAIYTNIQYKCNKEYNILKEIHQGFVNGSKTLCTEPCWRGFCYGSTFNETSRQCPCCQSGEILSYKHGMNLFLNYVTANLRNKFKSNVSKFVNSSRKYNATSGILSMLPELATVVAEFSIWAESGQKKTQVQVHRLRWMHSIRATQSL